ncbi:MAG: 6-phosphogluconolactonase [Lachnospiraceae bacterium]|nr:6-phosphogluconolactonase [Lachnospiraceae bacterium]
MRIIVSPDASSLGRQAAALAAEKINAAVSERGTARIVLSTGASQFTTLEALIRQDVDWTRVEMYHLDEYAGLPVTHPASFRRYLQERFISKVKLKDVHLVDGTAAGIETLTASLRQTPVDLGLIGIGENAHIAFNDPPADLETQEAYIFVDLNDACKRQQVREGWFGNTDEVPKQAVSMTVREILKCRAIISAVPFAVKADAVRKTLYEDRTPDVPATVLKSHPDFTLFVDEASFSAVDPVKIRPAAGVPFTLEYRP